MRLTRREALLAAGAGLLAACSRSTTPRAEPPAHPSGSVPAAGGHATPAPVSGGPATEVVHGPRDRQQVALTFHGAGSPSLARELLTEAERAGAAVTVFAIGQWLETHPEMARRILDGGHGLANHTYTHPSDMRSLPADAAEAQFTRAAAVLRRLSGSDGGYARPSAMDRATPLVLGAVGRAGYRTSVAFDVDPGDYRDPGESAVRSRTLAGVQPGSIVSLHLGHRGTVAALPGILDGLKARGLAPVTVASLLRA